MQIGALRSLTDVSVVTPRAVDASSSLSRGGVTAIDAVDTTLDLSASSRDVIGTYEALSPEERPEYLKVLSALLRLGVVGTETRLVDGKARKTFVEVGMADRSLRGKPYYRPQDSVAHVIERVA